MNTELRNQIVTALTAAGLAEQLVDRLSELRGVLGPELNWFDLLDAALEEPYLLSQRPQEIDRIVTQSAALLSLDRTRFVAAALKQPALFSQRPKTINKFVTDSALLVGLKRTAFAAAALKRPSLFFQRPETINKNITESAALLNLQKSAFAAAALRHPSLFYQRPETINQNVTRSAELLGVSKARFAAAAVKQPGIFANRPETIDRNVTRSAALLDIEKAEFVAGALKRPLLFTLRPQTLALKFKYVKAIVKALSPAVVTAEEVFHKLPNALCYSNKYLHLRYIIGKVVDPGAAASSLINLPSTKAEARVIAHYLRSPRTLQFMHAAGLIQTLPNGLKPAHRTRRRGLSL